MNLVDIANAALAEVGQQVTIAALTDQTVSARLCNLHIYAAIREVLGKGRWRAARGRAALTATTTPVFGWGYAYILPPDFLRVVRYNDTDPSDFIEYPYEIEGKLLLTDDSSVKLMYVKDLTYAGNDVNVFDPGLNRCFVLRLAGKLAWPLQQERTLLESIKIEFERELKKALADDARNARTPIPNNNSASTWLSSRVSSTDD